MKKTTKILLVLAAVVAMTIGAVSTVMAADEYPTIGEWITVDADKNLYEAKDTNGEDIIRGWAMSEAGRWYFFDSGYMLFNTFVTYKEEIYYLDNTGCMAKGWIGFTKDTKVKTVDKYVKDEYANITLIDGFDGAFEVDKVDALSDPLFEDTKVFVEDETYEVMYCYFDENGVMAQNEWAEAWGQWFYMYGPYCVMNDYHVAIDNYNTPSSDNPKLFNDETDGIYGFDKNGVMLVGWASYNAGTGAVNGTETDKDTPYEDLVGAAAAKDKIQYTYYYKNGRQVNTEVAAMPDQSHTDSAIFEGWEKIDGQWCYFVDDTVLGLRLLQSTMLYDIDTDDEGLLDYNSNSGVFYLDADGYMVTGVQSFAKEAKIVNWLEADTDYGTDLEVHDDGTAYFYFSKETGHMLDGIIDGYYYLQNGTEDDIDTVYLIENDLKGGRNDITTNGVISIDESTDELLGDDFGYLDGQRLNRNRNFFVVIKETADVSYDGDDRVETFVYYFEAGKLQKNQAITFGETTIGIDANGNVLGFVGVQGTASDAAVGKEVKVAGYTYKYADTTLTLDGADIVFMGIEKK